MIQPGRLFSFVSNYVLNNQCREIPPTNQIAFVNSISLVGQYFKKGATGCGFVDSNIFSCHFVTKNQCEKMWKQSIKRRLC